LRDKEKGVKHEIENVWKEWEDKCSDLEDTIKDLENKLH